MKKLLFLALMISTYNFFAVEPHRYGTPKRPSSPVTSNTNDSSSNNNGSSSNNSSTNK